MQQAAFVLANSRYCGFVCVNLRNLREILGFSFVQYRLSTLACYSPADYADHAEECSRAALSRRERQFDMVMRLLRFGRFFVVCLRISA